MLLDKYVLTKSFTSLILFHNPSSSASSASTPPVGFTKRVNAAMTRIDPLLKTLQVRPSPPEGLVQAYLIHIGDRSDTNFRKILDLKGVRKTDYPHLLELFSIHRDGFAGTLAASSSLLGPLMPAGGLGAVGLGISGASAGAASSLGEKLLNAARDGVDRLGSSASPALGGVASSSSAPGGHPAGGGAGPPGEKATINENLKNIGMFFRRDIGGLGARFGKRDVTPTGSGEER
jgi:vacuolar protein sorting-associated protein 53